MTIREGYAFNGYLVRIEVQTGWNGLPKNVQIVAENQRGSEIKYANMGDVEQAIYNFDKLTKAIVSYDAQRAIWRNLFK